MSTVSLAALMHYPELSGLEVVAGDPERIWMQVHLAVREDDLPTDLSSSLVIFPIVAFQGHWQLDALLRRLMARGCTGLALPPGSRVDEATRHLAVQGEITILQYGKPSNLAQVCWALLGGSDALTLFLVDRIAKSIERPARDLMDLLRNLAVETGLGVALVDASGVVAQAGLAWPTEAFQLLHFDAGRDLIELNGTTVASVGVADSRSIPVIRATRADLSSCCRSKPRTPARRRTMLCTNATAHINATAAVPMSRTSSAPPSTDVPANNSAPMAIVMYVPRRSHP